MSDPTADKAGIPDEVADPIDRLLVEARIVPPPGLAARLARAALDRDAGRRLFWSDLGQAARKALVAALAASLFIVGFDLGLLLGGRQQPKPAALAVRTAERAERAELDEVARLAISSAALETQIGGDLARSSARSPHPSDAGSGKEH